MMAKDNIEGMFCRAFFYWEHYCTSVIIFLNDLPTFLTSFYMNVVLLRTDLIPEKLIYEQNDYDFKKNAIMFHQGTSLLNTLNIS